MRRYSWLLLLAAGGGCDSAADQVRRGHELFAPSARKLSAGLLAETKARDPEGAARLLAEAGLGKDEEAFLAHSVQQILVRYGVVLSLTEEQAAAFRAGRFDDAGNRRRVDETLPALRKDGGALPDLCRYAIDRVRAGDWTALDLEFAARLLWGEAMRPR